MYSHEPIRNVELLNDQVNRLKPYVLALRLDATPKVAGIDLFKRLAIKVCSRVTGQAIVNGSEIPFNLVDVGQSLLCGQEAYLIVSASSRQPRLGELLLARYVAAILADVLQVERASDFSLLAAAEDRPTRTALLEEILGHECAEVLQRAMDTLKMEAEENDEDCTFDLEQFHPPDVDEEIQEPPPEKDPNPEGGKMERSSRNLPDCVEADEVPQDPLPPGEKIIQRVQTGKSSRGQVIREQRITDGGRCEKLTMLFEKSQTRYPLGVSALQGTHGFGCDVLSFESLAERKQFVRGGSVQIELVARFIEVKGRSSPNGPVPLEGNELRAARKYGGRYYIYRVFELRDGVAWQFVALRDPLAYDWEVSYEVDPFRCPDTSYWAVSAVGEQADGMEANQ